MGSSSDFTSADFCSSPLSSLPPSSPTTFSFDSDFHPLPSPLSSRCSEDRVYPIRNLDFSFSDSSFISPSTSRSLPSTPKRNLYRPDLSKISVSASKAVKSFSLPSLSDPPASPSPKGHPTATSHESTPPPKRRRPTAPRLRQSLRLDLTDDDITFDQQQEQVDLLLKVLHKKRKIVVIAGAGISVSAGSLFRTLRDQYNLKSSGKDLFDASVYQQESSTTSFHHMVSEMSNQIQDAKPTPFHHMLASLAQQGRLLRLYTQNVDSIDSNMEPLATKIPLRAPWPKTVQLHGSLEKSTCVKCKSIFDFDSSIFLGPKPPVCKHCQDYDFTRTTVAGKRSHGVGHLRPRMLLYNETSPDDLSIGTVSTADLKARPDALIVVGTTLKVPGTRRLAKEMASVVQSRRDGVTVWINYDREPSGNGLDKCWDLVVKGPCDKVADMASLRRWDDPEPEIKPQLDHSGSDNFAAPAKCQNLTVNVPSSSYESSPVITPGTSPQQQTKSLPKVQALSAPLDLRKASKLSKVSKPRSKKVVVGPKQPRKRADGKAPPAFTASKITAAFQVSKGAAALVAASKKSGATNKTLGDDDVVSQPPSVKAITAKPVRRVTPVGKIEKLGARARNARSRKPDMTLVLPGTSEFCLSSLAETTAPTPLPTASFRCVMEPSAQITWANPLSQNDHILLGLQQDNGLTFPSESAPTVTV